VLKGRLKYFALPFFLLGIILIVFLQFTSGRSINNLISSNRRLLDELKIQTDLQRLESHVVAAESDVRWIVITEDTIHIPEVKLCSGYSAITTFIWLIFLSSLADSNSGKIRFSHPILFNVEKL